MTEVFEPVDATDRDLALGATGLLASLQRRRSARPLRTSTSPARWGPSPASADDTVLLAVGARVPRACARGRSASTWRRSTATSRPELPWPDPDGGWPPSRAHPWWATACCGGSSACSTSTATDEQETQVCDDLALRRGEPPPLDADRLASVPGPGLRGDAATTSSAPRAAGRRGSGRPC